ncbi:hypothetical protein OIU74_002728 [Salix koriyanagi]|uniref:Uncharacterized protein n=1 Tax=Salix koriyanagi TaxID=2511006 RepID=A0A9Q1APY5_9ROSI|nr:hypothetical protein OIU74_002728 [Salix koriyanagi]
MFLYSWLQVMQSIGGGVLLKEGKEQEEGVRCIHGELKIFLKLIDQEKFPSLAAWKQEFTNAPIIRENWPDRDKLVTKYVAMREANLGKGTPK